MPQRIWTSAVLSRLGPKQEVIFVGVPVHAIILAQVGSWPKKAFIILFSPTLPLRVGLPWSRPPGLGSLLCRRVCNLSMGIPFRGDQGGVFVPLYVWVIPVDTGSNLGWPGSPLVSGDTDLGLCTCHICDISKANRRRAFGVKGDICFGREFDKGVESEATGIMCVALRCKYIYIYRYINYDIRGQVVCHYRCIAFIWAASAQV